ncbi:MAG: c-type cytochrome domain-containing protein, partial [Roseibacillus sp.]
MRLRGALWILLGSSSLVSGAEIRYNRDIRPLLSDNCFACHGPDANKVEAKLQLHLSGTARAPLGKAKDRHAIVPGKREESELWARITASDPDERMPPLDSHHELTPAQIELLGRWIDEGAKYEDHWSFQPLAGAKESSIDSFLRAELARSGLKPSGKADKATLLRRLTQDLTGLPPTPEEIVAF